MKEASISQLKNRLSSFLGKLKTYGSITITDHGSPIAVIYPISKASYQSNERLNRLVKSGLVSVPTRKPAKTLKKPSKISNGLDVAAILIEDRE